MKMIIWLLAFTGMILMARNLPYNINTSTMVQQHPSLRPWTNQFASTWHPIDYREVRCMSTAMYNEAGTESLLGKAAVGRVIQNRIQHRFGDSVCEIVYDKTNSVCQFSWVCFKTQPKINQATMADCRQLASQILTQNQFNSLVPDALYFHSRSVHAWKKLDLVKVIENHIFLKELE